MNRLSPPGLVLLVLGLVGPAMTATLPNKPFTFQCPASYTLNDISSVYDNATQDRTWEFACRDLTSAGFHFCRVFPPANNWNTDVYVRCYSSRDVIAGMASIYDNDTRDRIFLVVCCNCLGYARNCRWTNDLNEYGGPMNFSTPTAKILRGVKGRYSSSARDRIWQFEVCSWVDKR